MHPFLEITSSGIQQLDDEQARELVARLCKAELRRRIVWLVCIEMLTLLA